MTIKHHLNDFHSPFHNLSQFWLEHESRQNWKIHFRWTDPCIYRLSIASTCPTWQMRFTILDGTLVPAFLTTQTLLETDWLSLDCWVVEFMLLMWPQILWPPELMRFVFQFLQQRDTQFFKSTEFSFKWFWCGTFHQRCNLVFCRIEQCRDSWIHLAEK